MQDARDLLDRVARLQGELRVREERDHLSARKQLQQQEYICTVLQCAAVCCSVLQYATKCSSVLQHAELRCSVLQCVVVSCAVSRE